MTLQIAPSIAFADVKAYADQKPLVVRLEWAAYPRPDAHDALCGAIGAIFGLATLEGVPVPRYHDSAEKQYRFALGLLELANLHLEIWAGFDDGDPPLGPGIHSVPFVPEKTVLFRVLPPMGLHRVLALGNLPPVPAPGVPVVVRGAGGHDALKARLCAFLAGHYARPVETCTAAQGSPGDSMADVLAAMDAAHLVLWATARAPETAPPLPWPRNATLFLMEEAMPQ